jgi:8-oxo-dGTP diphosphatase
VSSDRRKYPDRPYVGVGAVIVRDGTVLLVKRKYEPLAGQWSLPGGAVEVGETLEACLVREMREETGLEVSVGPVIEVLDRISHDEEGRVMYHFVLVDYLCWPTGGALRAGSDVAEAIFASPRDLLQYDLTSKATSVVERALRLDRQTPGPRS